MGSKRTVLVVAMVLAQAGCSAEAQPEASVDSSSGDLRTAPTNNANGLAEALSRAVTGPVTVTSNQVVRLSAVQPVLSRTPNQLPPDPCRVELSFVDATGRVVATNRAEIGAGVEQHLDFTPSAGPSTNGTALSTRATLVPLVTPLAIAGRGTAPACLYSVQVLDKVSGRASVATSPKLFRELDGASLLRELEESRRPAAVELGFVSLAQGQTARLNLVNRGGLPGVPPDPCKANIAFVDAAGVSVAETQVNVAARTGTTFELSAAKLANGASVRAVISPIGKAGVPPDPCRFASLEVIDDVTGAASLRQEPTLVVGERDTQLSGTGCPVLSTNGVCPQQ